jgi:hypothetical protein
MQDIGILSRPSNGAAVESFQQYARFVDVRKMHLGAVDQAERELNNLESGRQRVRLVN